MEHNDSIAIINGNLCVSTITLKLSQITFEANLIRNEANACKPIALSPPFQALMTTYCAVFEQMKRAIFATVFSCCTESYSIWS